MPLSSPLWANCLKVYFEGLNLKYQKWKLFLRIWITVCFLNWWLLIESHSSWKQKVCMKNRWQEEPSLRWEANWKSMFTHCLNQLYMWGSNHRPRLTKRDFNEKYLKCTSIKSVLCVCVTWLWLINCRYHNHGVTLSLSSIFCQFLLVFCISFSLNVI